MLQAIKFLKETIDDCWDHDADARLTAMCVQERLGELPNWWKIHKGIFQIKILQLYLSYLFLYVYH